jgi:hypothetical protein
MVDEYNVVIAKTWDLKTQQVDKRTANEHGDDERRAKGQPVAEAVQQLCGVAARDGGRHRGAHNHVVLCR